MLQPNFSSNLNRSQQNLNQFYGCVISVKEKTSSSRPLQRGILSRGDLDQIATAGYSYSKGFSLDLYSGVLSVFRYRVNIQYIC